jgi:hypothetical protein
MEDAEYEGDLVSAGTFHRAGEEPVNSIARWDGSRWHPLGSGASYPQEIYCLAAYNGDLIAGGNFLTIGGISARHHSGGEQFT